MHEVDKNLYPELKELAMQALNGQGEIGLTEIHLVAERLVQYREEGKARLVLARFRSGCVPVLEPFFNLGQILGIGLFHIEPYFCFHASLLS